MDPVRKLIAGLIKDRQTTMSDVSKKIGRNHAYIQQFIERGVPRKLPEDARKALADLFELDETLLGGPLREPHMKAEFELPSKALPEYDVRAGAAYGGGLDDDTGWENEGNAGQKPIAHWGFPDTYVRNELGLSFGSTDVLPVRGDSMDDGTINALRSGDRVIVDRLDVDPRQGGIFAVWDGSGVIVKQVELLRGQDPPRIICKSRNPSYAPIELTIDGNVHVIGRISAKIARM